MSTDSIHKINLPIVTLPPTTVKVFPTCAQVERETKGITIKPGRNKITIPNLTRYADEQSVKVEGTGESAVITDISVEYIHNATLWPEDDNDNEYLEPETEGESDSEENIAQLAGNDAVELLETIEALKKQRQTLKDELESARKRGLVLDQFGDLLVQKDGMLTNDGDSRDPTATLEKYLHTYEKKGTELLGLMADLKKKMEDLDKQVRKQERRKQSILKEGRKQWKRKIEARRRAREEKEREFADKMAEKGPKFGAVHRVIIWIENISKGETDIGLKLSYIAKNASWVPRYDINLITSTATPSATLTYRAHVTNQTGEAWTECTVVLSTSQATFQGLQDHAPTLEQWNIRLARPQDHDFWALNKDGKEKLMLYSNQEKPNWYNVVTQQDRQQLSKGGNMLASSMVRKSAAPQASMFAADNSNVGGSLFGSSNAVQSYMPQAPQMQQQMQQQAMAQAAPAPAARSAPPGGLFGGLSGRGGVLFGSSTRDRDRRRESSGDEEDGYDDESGGPPTEVGDSSDEEDDSSETATLASAAAKMRFATPSQSSSGLTTTYTLQSPLTIPSSALPRRHLIAEIALNQVKLTHVCIPKLRTAVFLKARIKNTSSTPLLKGSTGLTLDGSFLGSLPLPAAQPNEEFTLQLGVDTSVHVVYGKVQRKRALEKGIWNKESCTGFSRSITLQNGRPSPVSLTVIDQVPVSEDEKIKVTILTPKGLELPTDEKKGNVVSTGTPLGLNGQLGVESTTSLSKRLSTVRSGGNTVWGSAKAELKKNGEIRWNVELRGGKGVGLGLDYQVTYPKDTGIMALQ